MPTKKEHYIYNLCTDGNVGTLKKNEAIFRFMLKFIITINNIVFRLDAILK